MRTLCLLAIATIMLLVLGCESTASAIQNMDVTIQTYMADSAAQHANMTNRITQLQERVESLEATLERIEENTQPPPTPTQPAETRDIWKPPADITEDMDPFEAAAKCLSDKLYATAIAETLGNQIQQSFMGDIGASDEDEALRELGPFMRYLFCGF